MAPKRHISATLHKRCGDRHPLVGKLAVCHVVQLVVAAGHPVVGDERPRPARLWSSALGAEAKDYPTFRKYTWRDCTALLGGSADDMAECALRCDARACVL